MTIWRDLAPVLRLFADDCRNKLLLGALLAATTVLSGMALLGLSGWFITATAIAGLNTTLAFTFDVLCPRLVYGCWRSGAPQPAMVSDW
jgi:ATP-binding cassette subfamily C protein CydC